MKIDLDKLFNRDFDISEPTVGHFERFEKKISSRITIETQKKPKTEWKWIAIAASVVLIFGIWLGQNEPKNHLDLADISPKMEETQDYFTTVIRTEIEKVNLQKTDENSKLITDSFLRLEQLEQQYKKLTVALKDSDADKRVIFAMISNYQQRIEILENLLNQLDNIKQIKTTTHENFS